MGKAEDMLAALETLEGQARETEAKITEARSRIRSKERDGLLGVSEYGDKSRRADETALQTLERELASLGERQSILKELILEERADQVSRQVSVFDQRMKGLADEAEQVFTRYREAFDRMISEGIRLEELRADFSRLSAERSSVLQGDDPAPIPFPLVKTRLETACRLRNLRVPEEARRMEGRLPWWQERTESLGDPAATGSTGLYGAPASDPLTAPTSNPTGAALNSVSSMGSGSGLIADFQSILTNFRRVW